MLFNSASFLIFFPVVCLLYFIIPTHRLKNIWLLLASYFFYMSWDVKYGTLLFATTLVSYICAVCLERFRKSPVLVIGLLFEFGVLFAFKYFTFFTDTFRQLFSLNVSTTFSLVLPVGISFYIFQNTSYLIDVYRGDTPVEHNFLDYALYISFFPQLVAGPIERSSYFLKQFKETYTFDYNRVKKGLLIMLWGYFLKLVIADRAALLVDNVYSSPSTASGSFLFAAAILFALQIYCDFAGYSTIALGAGMVLGFRMTDNFQSPYFSRSISEFWRRWHVSLYEWFKNYLYIPLGGSRKGILRKYCNLLIVCTVSGLWHGANWTYVIWGLINGIYQLMGAATLSLRNRIRQSFLLRKLPEGISQLWQSLWVYLLFAFSLIFFRAESISSALGIIKTIFTASDFSRFADGSLLTLGINGKNMVVLLLSVLLLWFADRQKAHEKSVVDSLLQKPLALQWLIYLPALLGVILFGIYGKNTGSFIYFVF